MLTITEIQRKTKHSGAPALYDLTALQREANQKYGFSAKETLNIMQRLYENHKVLTYPRTDSRYLTTDMLGTIEERLKACAVGPYKKLALKLSRQKIHGKPAFVNNSKVSDHHAIIPTEQFVKLTHMSNEERKIYDLVVRRFLAVLCPACEYEETSIKAKLGTETFAAHGTILKAPGWREAYEQDYEELEEDDMEDSGFGMDAFSIRPDIPESSNDRLREETARSLRQGASLPVSRLSMTEGKTKPPAHFTEGTLIAAMENPVKYLQRKDKNIIRTLGETGGLGTVATRADIIEKLFNSFLMEKRGNKIHLTSKGKQLLELVPQDLKSPELTASWEQRLQAIAAGKESDRKFMAEIQDYTESLIHEIKTGNGTFRHDNLSRTKCPQCGKYMLEVNGKHGKMLVCQDRECGHRECGHRETISRHTNARCPVCHKKMELVGKEDGQRFVCVCGYKEKLSAFEERRKKEGKDVSKRDVNNYLKKQAKEAKEPINNAFAEAFAKIKLDE